MRKMRVLLGAVLFCLLLFCGSALAQEARDITRECALKGSVNTKLVRDLMDRDYKTYWQSQGGRDAYLQVTLPGEKTCGGVLIKWAREGIGFQIQAKARDSWETVAVCPTGRLVEYVPLPEGVSLLRIVLGDKVKGRMQIAELYVFDRGGTPDWVQRWQPPPEKADLLVIFAHPDDEVLFMGGTIPYYAGERKMQVVAACLVPASHYRRLELMDSLWLCGVRTYPEFGNMTDAFAGTLEEIYKKWSKDKLYQYVVMLYRKYKPDVVVSHDVYGEYGHGAHRAAADAARGAIKYAADAKKYRDTSKQYGTWQLPKLYLHLYKENRIRMDWRQPLEAFGGRTAFEMAQEGYACHYSQRKSRYKVEDSGPYDNSLFGLAYTRVGPDVEKNNFFEHIPPARP